MPRRIHLQVLLIFVVALSSTHPFKWSPDLEDNVVKHTCLGDDLHLLWDFNITSGENISSIEWFFRAESEEVVAMFAHGNFLPMSTFSKRVRYVPGAGIVLSHVTPGDKGAYSVEVLGHDVNNTFINERRTAKVQLGEPPSTDHGDLEVGLDQTAVYDNLTDQWSVRLTCGHFVHTGQPPVRVVWTTPSGRTAQSSGFKNGNFYLQLSNPVKGGNYMCSLDPQTTAASCLSNSSRLLQSSALHVDGVETGLILLQAEKEALQEKVQQLKEKNVRQEEKESNMTNYIHELEEQVLGLQNTTRPCRIVTGPCAAENHTVLNDNWRDVNHQKDANMCDKSLPVGWYRFLINGTSATMPTRCIPEEHCGTSAPLWLDLQGADLPAVGQELHVRSCASWKNECCHWEKPVTVLNCGTYFVYHLSQAPYCTLAYCATMQIESAHP
ncbi:uncharacterized protein [Littorina saxatilis]|uniref:UMOD/GP2/OIT3-like D8C domain-containing protein n=1 Tax=Littorina saxatilis TaxID=31220 RepID=A0AAN9GIK4_9CAEN